jgi:hypothetical protein
VRDGVEAPTSLSFVEGPQDEELVPAVRSGNPSAFEALYKRHAPAIRRVVAEAVRGADGVDDAVQEVFVKALDRFATLRQPDQFGASQAPAGWSFGAPATAKVKSRTAPVAFVAAEPPAL